MSDRSERADFRSQPILSDKLLVAEYLRAQGHDVLTVAELMPSAPDWDILARATQEQRILVTNDKDFGELVFVHQQAYYGVILFRITEEDAAKRVRLLAAALAQYANQLVGHFVVIKDKSIRLRRG